MTQFVPAASSPRSLELLAPAKNLAVGIAAILAGADAVYIGGPAFGARSAAGNSIEDLYELARFAHRFGARVYMTLNTLIYDSELDEARKLIVEAKKSGIDALIIQDAGLLTLPELRGMEVHVSTQWNVDSLAKVDHCLSLGAAQIVLPREFDLSTIEYFCTQRPQARFEVFVSGAMCVSVSGICYISEYMTKRSANRGECVQICRLPMSMYHESANGVEPELIASGHLLSMKDNLRLSQLESLVRAGASSFKIEGRLKEREYVINQVAAFREQLDRIIEKSQGKYKRASLGKAVHSFSPQVSKTFNRGFTDHYLQADNSSLVETRTPKSLGEYLGKVVRCYNDVASRSWVVELALNSEQKLSNGDSFAYFKDAAALSGFRVNRVALAPKPQPNAKSKQAAKANKQESSKESYIQAAKGSLVQLFLPKRLTLAAQTKLYRNVDTFFIKTITMPKALERKIALRSQVSVSDYMLQLSFSDEWGRKGVTSFKLTVPSDTTELKELKPLSRELMVQKLVKLGDEYLSLSIEDISFDGELEQLYLSVSEFNGVRRSALQSYLEQVYLSYSEAQEQGLPYLNGEFLAFRGLDETHIVPYPYTKVDPRLIKNKLSAKFYETYCAKEAFVSDVAADESSKLAKNLGRYGYAGADSLASRAVMTCRNCLIKNHAKCKDLGGQTRGYYLVIGKERFDIVTDCKHCLMYLLAQRS